MIEFTQKQFDEIKTKGEVLYKSLVEVYCPYFKEKVSFNARGLEHLKFKSFGKNRDIKDQFMRLKLINLAPEVIRTSSSLQGIFETKAFERIRVSSRTDMLLKPVIYYEFIAVIKRNRVRIIVKQIDNGSKFFWSIIPFWGMNTETMRRILHSGDPELE